MKRRLVFIGAVLAFLGNRVGSGRNHRRPRYRECHGRDHLDTLLIRLHYSTRGRVSERLSIWRWERWRRKWGSPDSLPEHSLWPHEHRCAPTADLSVEFPAAPCEVRGCNAGFLFGPAFEPDGAPA